MECSVWEPTVGQSKMQLLCNEKGAFILYFRLYLLRLKFNYKLTIVPYNEFTETLRNRKDKLPDGWKKLQQFEFEIIHCKGLCHTNADALPDLRVLSVTFLRNKD